MIRDSNADGNDSILIEYYGMDDIDPVSLRQYRTEFRQENSTHVWNQVDDKTFLRNLGGYTEDRQTGREVLDIGRTDDVWQRARYQRQVLKLSYGLSGYESSGG